MNKNFYFALITVAFLLGWQDLAAQNCPLVANNHVNISLGSNCEAVIDPDDVLESPGQGCPYVLVIYDPNGNPIGNVVTDDHIGMTLEFRVFVHGNHTWGTLLVEDKLAPVIQCQPTVTTLCSNVNQTGIPPHLVSDNCDPSPQIVVIHDNYNDLPCSNQFTGIRTITYKAVDQSGNESAPCTQTIQYRRANLTDVSFPLNRDGIQLPALQCGDYSWDKNNNNYPDPLEVGVPKIGGSPIYPNGSFCDLQATFHDSEFSDCGSGYKILRTWTVYDWCSSGSSRTETQIIKISDNSTPSIHCPHDITISGGYSCKASTQLPAPHISGSCGGSQSYTVTVNGGFVDFVNGFYVVSGLSPGTYTATYSTTNPCGGYPATCTMHITVKGGGGSGPIPVCDQNTVVSLGIDGKARIYAETFNDGSHGGNCGNVSKIEVRRMSEGHCPYGVEDDTKFRPYVEVCCADIGHPVTVVLRVWDDNWQWNECMVHVHVQDKLPPKIVCPPDITIDCDYPIDINDLSQFGRVVTDEDHRQPIYIDGVKVGYDGFAKDNCEEIWVEEKVEDNRSCKGGFIKRKFIATDWGGAKSTCIQKIYVDGGGGFSCKNIKWPRDVELNSCAPHMTGPEYTGRPEIKSKGCGSLIATNYKDEVFEVVNGFCYKILRTWKVLDWCTYDPYDGKGSKICEYVQVIKVIDDDKPKFVDQCKDITVCPVETKGCSGLVTIAPWVDDCTPEDYLQYEYYVDEFDNNPGGLWDITGNTKNFHRYLPYGTHRILWRVKDGCGNMETCSYRITVTDCKEPTPYCINGLSTVVMPSTGAIEVEAHKFDIGSFDNCTPNSKLKFSFSSDVNDKKKLFTCEDVGPNEVEVWVTDEAGNQDYCVTYILIQDNLGTCPDTSSMIEGSISTIFDVGVPNTDVTFAHASFIDDHNAISDGQGSYALPYLGPMQCDSIMVQPTSNWSPYLGVSAYDLYLLQLHMIGLTTFAKAEQYVAADVNKDGSINAFDYFELRDFLLRRIRTFSNNNSWRFVDDSYKIPMNYSQNLPLPEMKYVSFFNRRVPDVNFTGIKIGDLDFDGVPGIQGRSAMSLPANVVVNESNEVRLELAQPMAISALEISMDKEIVESLTINDMNLHVEDDFLIAVSTQSSGIPSQKLNVVCHKGLDEAQINDIWQKANVIAYDTDGNMFRLDLTPREGMTDVALLDFTISPNPVHDQFQIQTTVKEAGSYVIQMVDVEGKIQYESRMKWAEGQQLVQVQTANLPAGMYSVLLYNNKGIIAQERIVKQ